MELTCPKCHAPMWSYERNGVTIEQCTDCRGLFLDRGELERLTAAETGWYSDQPRHEERQHRSDDRYREHGPKKKRRSFLADLFD